MGLWVKFCVRDAAATRAQYLALNKAGWSCSLWIVFYCI